MTTCTVIIPNSLTLENTIGFSNHIKNLPEVDEYIFDFDALDWVEPFSLLFLSSEIERCRIQFHDKQFIAINHKSKTYAGHMGFFQSFGCDFGKKPGEAPGSSRYIPITIYNSSKLRKDAASNYEEVGQFIENNASEMAHVLTRSNSGELFDTLTYSIREIIRNVIEHSGANMFGFCAQYWPNKNKVELAILDRGIGIREGLSTNPHLNIKDDHDALNLSLMPGISGKSFEGSTQNKNDFWANSGYGLYMTSRLCREGGSFFINSGSKGLLLSETQKELVNSPFKGTALRLILNTESIGSFSGTLDRYRKEAYQLLSKVGRNNLTASVASTMLSKDFKNID